VIVVASLVLAGAMASDGVIQAKGRGHSLTGTWFVSLPSGLTGFYTYHHGGTMTGSVSGMFGAPPWPSEAPTLNSADHGVWRRVRKGFEGTVFRMVFDPDTGDPVTILRIRMLFAFDSGRRSTSGTYKVDVWACPDALSCPDPNRASPDASDVGPPPPFDGFTQTRVQMP
jgi:hypothetical protein